MAGKATQTVDGYFGGFPPDVEALLHRVRDTIRSVAPDAEEAVKYDMALFRYAGTYLYVAGWKKHIGMYPIYPAEPELEAEIAPYRAKKDTVQFKYAKPMPYELIARIAEARKKQG